MLCAPSQQEFLKFLERLDEEFPGDVPLHLVMDNYGTHKQPKVQAWWKRHPRFVPHFVPTSSSWLNLVERWFGELTSKRVRRGSFRSVADLVHAIEEYLAAWNENPRPWCGRPQWSLSCRSCPAAGRLWRRFSQVAPCRASGKERGERKIELYAYL